MHKLARFLVLVCLVSAFALAHTNDTLVLRTAMSTANEVPPVTGVNGNSETLVLVHVNRDDSGKITNGFVDFVVNFNLDGPINLTGMHIHEGPAGQNASVVIPTDLSGSNPISHPGGNGFIFKQVVVNDAALLTRLLANPSGFYANIHTTTSPGGVMRGQLSMPEAIVLRTTLLPQNEVPPVTNVDVSGSASIRVLASRDGSGNITDGSVIFDVNYRFANPADLTGLHVHNGPAGANAGIVFPTTAFTGGNPLRNQTVGSVTEIVPARSAVQLASLAGLFVNPAGFYANIHTTVNGGGVARGQLLRTGRIVMRTDLEAANEAPPTTAPGSGVGHVVINYTRNAQGRITGATFTFDVNVQGFPENTTVTGLHIHNGPVGLSAGVVISSGLGGSNTVNLPLGSGNLFRTIDVDADNATALNAINDMLANPGGFYLNLHTTVNPGGAIRGQMGTALTTPPQVSANGIISAVLDTTAPAASPGALISIFGTNLAAIESDPSGLDQPFLPIAMNGTEVRIGSRQAPLIYVGPTQINAQVPYETDAGPAQVLVVRNGSFSSPYGLTVLPASPGIFLIPGAAALKVSDFSVVSPNNPATAGDVLAIFCTGLGRVTPAITSGQFAPLSTNVPLTAVQPAVTVGGKAADVLVASLAPGFAGLYQVAIRVPTGLGAGNQPVVISVGDQKSNTAQIALK